MGIEMNPNVPIVGMGTQYESTQDAALRGASGVGSQESVPAVAQVKNGDQYQLWDGVVPSLGANVLAAITDLSNEQRRLTAQTRFEEALAVADRMEDQADNIRTQAALQLAMGIVSGLIQLAGSFAQASETANAIKVAGGNQQLLSALTSQASALGQMINSFSTMVNAGNTFAGGIYEAANKEIDAEIERMRADLTTLDNLEQALKEVLHKAQSTMESINQSTDSARRKILG